MQKERTIAAVLLALAAYLLWPDQSPTTWPNVPTASTEAATPPKVKPTTTTKAATINATPTPPPALPVPPPIPQGEDYDAALKRAEITGRPFLVLLGAAWCQPCQWIDANLLPDLRRKGELALVDVDQRADLAAFYFQGQRVLVPRLVVYRRAGNAWQLVDVYKDANAITAYTKGP